MAEHELPRRKHLRLQGFDYSSARPYFVTVCTHNRRPLFADREAAKLVLKSILDGARDTGFAVLALCVMPDHWHALVMPRANRSPLGDMVRAAKGKATARLRALGMNERAWQAKFYDHIVRAEEDLRQIAEYIVNNPVRKGMVVNAEDYPLAKIFPDEFPV